MTEVHGHLKLNKLFNNKFYYFNTRLDYNQWAYHSRRMNKNLLIFSNNVCSGIIVKCQSKFLKNNEAV